MEYYDVIVVGSGHAGIEASLASARLGCRTLMITQNLDTIGQMSCNPAIGGSAKSHLVKEIDALAGAMGLNADATGIQFRTLNKSKGPAVWATRIQCDKKAYQFRLKALLEATPNLRLLQATVVKILAEGNEAVGVRTDLGFEIRASAVVLTAGTFLRGLLHVGEQSKAGGRMGDPASMLSENIRELGFESGRFKTGTPCRVNGRSIKFDKLQVQPGEEPPPRLSHLERIARDRDDFFTLNFDEEGMFHVEQLPCWITETSPVTHSIIRENLHRSPLYQRRIEGTGPRYCPSIEDKIVRFAHRESHHVFLEPEGRHSHEFYVNGISTSLPFDVQVRLIQSIRGLEDAEILRAGYAVEYDYFPPTQLRQTLESKRICGLYFAGQVNGTSGYEEAAGQGLVAGANAALKVKIRAPFVLDPEQSYIGVLISDLVTRGTDEPYRMFTSRAANRLRLREDNADLRLMPVGVELGLVDSARESHWRRKKAAIADLEQKILMVKIDGRPLAKAIRDPGFHIESLPTAVSGLAERSIWRHVIAEATYEGYIARDDRIGNSAASRGGTEIPEGTDFESIPGLRTETRQKLSQFRPTSLDGARRISGLTAADLSILDIWLRQRCLCK